MVEFSIVEARPYNLQCTKNSKLNDKFTLIVEKMLTDLFSGSIKKKLLCVDFILKNNIPSEFV
jgi:hypothetical protein